MIVLVLTATSCSNRGAEPARPLTLDEARAKVLQCAPAAATADDPALAVQSVTFEPQATKVIIQVSTKQASDFHFPVYRLSSGRWLINGKGHAYLLDEECREYKLKDRKSLPGFEIPLEGQIRLKADQRFEAVLVFPRISERSRVGMLVYDGRSLPLVFGPESR